MDFVQFIPEQLAILSAALWVLGVMLKNAEFIKDNYIPFVLLALGIVFSLAIMGFSAEAILQGIMCAAAAVLVENIKKQVTQK